MLTILSVLLIGFIVGVNLENLFSNKTYKLFEEYDKTTTECIESQKNLILSLGTKADYYKAAYEGTIIEHIKLMKLMNRRKKNDK